MKKCVMIFAIVLCACSLFAFENSLIFSAMPGGKQITTSTIDNSSPITSSYATAVELAFQHSIKKGFYAEVGVGVDYFFFEPQVKNVLKTLSCSCGIGLKWRISHTLSGFVHSGISGNASYFEDLISKFSSFKLGFGLEFDLLDNLKLDYKLDGTVSHALGDAGSYTTYRILPMIGLSYLF